MTQAQFALDLMRDPEWVAESAVRRSLDAVVECLRRAGTISQAQAAQWRQIRYEGDFAALIAPNAPLLAAAGIEHAREVIRTVPPGAILGFIDVDPDRTWLVRGAAMGVRRLVHVMLSLGGGWAIGARNDEIGLGGNAWRPVNLVREAQWIVPQGGACVAGGRLGRGPARPLRIRYHQLPGGGAAAAGAAAEMVGALQRGVAWAGVPTAGSLKPHNCHEAAMGWLLQAGDAAQRAVGAAGIPGVEGVEAAWATVRAIVDGIPPFAGVRQATGPWIGAHLYQGAPAFTNTAVPRDLAVGDLIGFGDPVSPVHSMVVERIALPAVWLRGFNNAGGFGDPRQDLFMQWDPELRDLLAGDRWTANGRFRAYGDVPVLRVPLATAVARVQAMVPQVQVAV